jgi:hypothetical protein
MKESDPMHIIRSRFPHLLGHLQTTKMIGMVVQPFTIVIVVTLQEHDLCCHHLHGLLLFLDDCRQLADQVVMVFQGSPLGQHLTLQVVDLSSMVVL